MKFRMNLLVPAIALAAASSAQAQIYKAILSGANENPPVVTSATGTTAVTINTTTNELRVKAVFSGLNGATTASHIHCCVIATTANAGVLTATPSFAGFPNGVTSANFDATYDTRLNTSWNASAINANGGTPAGATAAFATGIAAGGAYLNVHTATSPGGEIRGNLVRFSFVPAATELTKGVASALDSLGAATGVVNERLVGMAFASTAEQGTAMAALLPASSLAVATVAGNGLFGDYDQISNRLGGLRTADTGSGLWGKAANRDGEQTLANRGGGVDSDGWDMTGGYDMALGSTARIGVAVGYGEDSLDYTGRLRGAAADLEGWRATVYAEQRMGSAFIEGMLTMAQYDIDAVRNTGAGGLATSATEADAVGGRVAAGFGIRWQSDGASAQFTPQVRLDWASVDLDGYREASAGGMALDVRSKSEDRMRLSIGGQSTGLHQQPFAPMCAPSGAMSWKMMTAPLLPVSWPAAVYSPSLMKVWKAQATCLVSVSMCSPPSALLPRLATIASMETTSRPTASS